MDVMKPKHGIHRIDLDVASNLVYFPGYHMGSPRHGWELQRFLKPAILEKAA